MPKTEEYMLRPLGWENDPEEERIRLSTMDYLAAATFNSYALFFKLEDSERPKVVEALKAALERTLAQCRQLVGTLEKNTDNDDHSFVKKRDSTVKFQVAHWDGDADGVPSMADLEKAHFCSAGLGDLDRFVVPGFEYGERPEATIAARPVTSAFKANFIPGGLIFVSNHHHYANDARGWSDFVHQLAENCRAGLDETGGSSYPDWDAANLDATRFTAVDFPPENKVDGPPAAQKHPDTKPQSMLLLHLPKSKAAELKRLATPPGPDGVLGKTWISTYDAFAAQLWRVFTKHRAALYRAAPDANPIFGEGINVRPRVATPVGPRQQRNLFAPAASIFFPPAFQPTVKQVAADASLAELAVRWRTLSDSMDQAGLDGLLGMLSPVRDKTALYTRADSFPPLFFGTTDWRQSGVCGTADFGFASPLGFRHLFSTVTNGITVIYPSRAGVGAVGEDEGVEMAAALENELVDAVLADPDFTEYFEFRGYEVKGN